jgi:hypothetical protein
VFEGLAQLGQQRRAVGSILLGLDRVAADHVACLSLRYSSL